MSVVRSLGFLIACVLFACDGTECPTLDFVPTNDPQSQSQWFFPKLGVVESWAIVGDGEPVLVAVVDNGFDVGHPDLVDNLFRNPDDTQNGVDDDQNGFVDDYHGWDFLDGDGNVELAPERIADDVVFSHGTRAAGVIAAKIDNQIGISGACSRCKLLLIRARDFGETLSSVGSFRVAVDYAVSKGARVLSISDGIPTSRLTPELRTEIDDAMFVAERSNLVVVASSGNDSLADSRWPAAHPLAVSVAATDVDGEPTQFTNDGSDVIVAAPGVCVPAPSPGGNVARFDGTSASTPLVASLAAMIIAKNPEFSAAQVRERLAASATMPITSKSYGGVFFPAAFQ